MIYSTSKPIPLYLVAWSNEKNSFQWFHNEASEEKREGYQISHKAKTTRMGGVSIAQSHKHNKYFQELIILHEVSNASS